MDSEGELPQSEFHKSHYSRGRDAGRAHHRDDMNQPTARNNARGAYDTPQDRARDPQDRTPGKRGGIQRAAAPAEPKAESRGPQNQNPAGYYHGAQQAQILPYGMQKDAEDVE